MMHLTVIFKSTIMCQQFYSLFILFTFLTTNALAIKVDFNTNTGPIIPPTSTEAPVPKPPFREPAPVWEDQSDDIPNPHPYKYVAPPTTRPRYNDPFGDKSVQSSTVPPQHGNIVYHPNQIHDQNNKIVNSLTVKYIPNYGNKYVAVVPANTKVQYLNNNEIYDNINNDNNNYYYDNNNNNNNNNYNNKNINNVNNNDYNYNYYDDISHNKYDKYRKYEKYDNLQKSNSKYRLKNKKYNAYEEKKKYWPIYLYHIPHQQQVYVYNYQT